MKGSDVRSVKLIVLGFFLLMQFWLLFLKKHDTLDLNVTPATNPTLNFWGTTRMAQSFISRINGLSRIDVSLATHGRPNTKDVIFELREAAPDASAFAHLVFNASSVQNNAFRAFSFPSQRRSAGKKYIFSLTSPDSSEPDSICIWMNQRDIYKEGNYIIDGRPQEGDLNFRVYSRRAIISELRRVVRNYPGIMNNPALFIAAAVVFMLAEVLVLLRLLDLIFTLRKEPREGSNPLG